MYFKQLFFPLLAPLLFAAVTASSQTTTSSYTPKIIPPSPNAATIAKFGDMPVSTYTGTTDISIPFSTVSTKNISIPVSIDYHTGGIRLGEESGLVGLGWALNAGGMISRTINAKDDFEDGYFNGSLAPFPNFPEVKGKLLPHNFTYNPSTMGDWGYQFECNYQVYSEMGNVNYFPNIIYLSMYDMEPDMYNFNFPGGGGKFIIGRDGKIILQKQENLKIEYATDGSSFTITDEHGNKFYFLDKEYSQPATGGELHTSSWLLSKIVTQQKDSVMLNYTVDSTYTTVKGVTHETLRIGVPNFEQPIYSNDVGQTYLNKTLNYIDWANGQIQFVYDANRADLQNGKKLNTVKVYTKDQAGLHYQKENRLYYSYFNNTLDPLEFQRLKLDSVKEVSGSTILPPYKFDYNVSPSMQSLSGKHYSSVDHWGYFNGKDNGISIGTNIDHTLGFTAPYTGSAAMGGPHVIFSQYINLPGADREADFTYMQSFSLNKVTYPTVGSTQLEYEPNYYDYDSSKATPAGRDFEYVKTIDKVVQITINSHGSNGNGNSSGTINFSDIYQTSSSVSNANLTVSFRAARSDSMTKYHTSGFGNINFIFNGNTYDITNSTTSMYLDGSGTVYSLQTPITISSASANYNWSAIIDPKIKIPDGFIEITATFTYTIPLYKTTTMMMAGGLRIKSITDYAASGTIAKKRTYDYGYLQDRNGDGTSESYSNGRLMGYLSYARSELIEVPTDQIGNYGTGQSFTRYSSNFSGFTSLSSGNIVGYDQVTEYTVDPASSNDNGKTVYSYYNSSDSSFSYNTYRFPGVNNLPNNLNGVLRSKTVYKDIGKVYTKVAESNYYYHTANRVIYDCMKYIHMDHASKNNPGDIGTCFTQTPPPKACSCPSNLDSAMYQLMANLYPAISSEKVLLDSTIEKIYDQSDISKVIVNKSYNYYDNPKHYQPTRNKSTDSKLNNHTTFIRYPQDYITSGNYTGNTILDSLIGRNMIAEAIEKRDSLYYAGSSTGYIVGAQLSKYRFLNANVLGLDKQFQLSIASPVTNFQPFAISGNTTSQDSRYRQMISFDTYDNNYNILQFTVPNQSASSFIYDYNKQYPVAQIVKATSDQVAYTSFESDGKGNWNNFTGAITTITVSPFPPTGSKYYNLTISSTLSKTVTTGKIYIISYWSKNGLYTITNGGTPVNTTGKTINGWTYYEQKVTAASTTLTITGTGAIDELRLYPFDAQMSTYTYDPFGNILSACDINNRISYYEYDELHRLNIVMDQDRNVVKKICYNYAGQPSSCEGFTFKNTIQQQSFQKLSCNPSYYTGSNFTYTVPANTYYSELSLADANQKALDDIAANGQNYANSQPNGCTAPPMINLTYVNPGTTSMTAVFKHKLSGTTYTFPLSSGKTTSTLAGQIMQGGPYDVTITPTSGSYFYNFQVYNYMYSNRQSFSYTDMPSICSTCATISITNQHLIP